MKSTKQLYEHFCIFFPTYASRVEAYFPHGENAIRIRLTTYGIEFESEFVFTYKDGPEWKFETLKNHIKEGVKNGKKKGA